MKVPSHLCTLILVRLCPWLVPSHCTLVLEPWLVPSHCTLVPVPLASSKSSSAPWYLCPWLVPTPSHQMYLDSCAPGWIQTILCTLVPVPLASSKPPNVPCYLCPWLVPNLPLHLITCAPGCPPGLWSKGIPQELHWSVTIKMAHNLKQLSFKSIG